MGKKRRISRGYCGSNRLGSPYQYTRWVRGSVQGRTPPRPWEESLLGQLWPRTKETAYHWEWHSGSLHGIGKVPKQKRITKRIEMSKGKSCHYCIQCLVPDIAMLFCLYNHSQLLRRRADETSISTRNPIQEEGNYYKKGWREAEKGGWNPYHSRGTRKSSSDCAEDQPSLINSVHPCLIVINTMLTVAHALKPSSSTHSLQIYCIGLTGPRSHTSCMWLFPWVFSSTSYCMWLFGGLGI